MADTPAAHEARLTLLDQLAAQQLRRHDPLSEVTARLSQEQPCTRNASHSTRPFSPAWRKLWPQSKTCAAAVTATRSPRHGTPGI
jgi:hypothetical protein